MTTTTLARKLGTTANVIAWVMVRDRLTTDEHGFIGNQTSDAIEAGLGDCEYGGLEGLNNE